MVWKTSKKWLWLLLRIGVPVGVIAFLLYRMNAKGEFSGLTEQPKQWSLLLAGFVLTFLGVTFTFVRWYLLVITLKLPFTIWDAFRLGFIGFLLNFVTVGSVGGDLFKAVFLAHEHPERRPSAVTSVMLDRIFGLVALMLVTATAVLVMGPRSSSAEVSGITHVLFIMLGVIVVGGTSVLAASFLFPNLGGWLAKLPFVGPVLGKVLGGLGMYRSRPDIVLICLAMSVGTHLMFASGIYVAARGLYAEPPTFAEHVVMVPLANLAGAIPLTPAGMGTYEVALDKLYELIPAQKVTEGSGLIVALAYRVMTFLVAGVGVVFYMRRRKEVEATLEEAEHELEHEAEASET